MKLGGAHRTHVFMLISTASFGYPSSRRFRDRLFHSEGRGRKSTPPQLHGRCSTLARTRSIKPGFFTNEILGGLPYQDRLLFAGLWTIADKEGRLEDRPARIRGELFPYDHEIDVEASLLRLESSRFIHRYITGDPPLKCILVNNFKKHQSPHHTEKSSTLPTPEIHRYLTVNIPPSTLIPSTLIPSQEQPVRSEFDEQWQKFKTDYEAAKPDLLPEDWSRANYAWRILDFEQKLQAIAGIQLRLDAGQWVDPQFIPKPDRYLREDRKRKVVPRKLSSFDQINRAIEEA
jgi:hypothetical protein